MSWLSERYKRIWNRDGRKCRYCQTPLTLRTMTIDHVEPRSKGGGNSDENLACCCEVCNASKWDTPLDEWLEWRRTHRGRQ